jgi:hypothetical protein
MDHRTDSPIGLAFGSVMGNRSNPVAAMTATIAKAGRFRFLRRTLDVLLRERLKGKWNEIEVPMAR